MAWLSGQVSLGGTRKAGDRGGRLPEAQMEKPYLVFPLIVCLHLLQQQRPCLSSYMWGDPFIDPPVHLRERRCPKTGARDTPW